MSDINSIVSEFQNEKDTYHPTEAIKILLQGLNRFPDNTELLHYLLDYMNSVRTSNVKVIDFYHHIGYKTESVTVLGKRFIND